MHKRDAVDSVKEKYYRQWIDHKTTGLGKFNQRYYIDESYATSDDAPVFLYLCGEAPCEKTVLDGTIRDLAQKYHARLLALEHRYYGKSLPVKNFSTPNLKYLTYQNAMNDIAGFEKDTQHDRLWTGKWIVFGGSYSATVSAYYREQFPQLVAGAVASSAPVMPKETFTEFDAHATKMAGPECANNIRKVVNEIEGALPDQTRMTEIKTMFRSADVSDNLDFLELLADVSSAAVQYGYKDVFCGMLAESSSPMQGFAGFTNYMLDAFGIDAVQLTPQGAMSENPDDYMKVIGLRQWSYQVCTQFGAWQIANPDPAQSTRSQLLDLEYNKNVCRRLFGIEAKPDIDYLTRHFYQPLFDESISSNIYFTNGSDDPWSRMSLIDENGNTTNTKLSYFMIEGGAHCDDLRKPDDGSQSLRDAKSKMDDLIKTWLSV